jgi:predicted metal-dependent phosphotriesterase family hydrolase
VDINIIVATGIYTCHEAPIQCRFTGPGCVFDVPEPMVELFVKDIREGIAGTGVKAGLLKCAIDEHSLTPDVERILRAVGQTHVETGTPITVHTSAALKTGPASALRKVTHAADGQVVGKRTERFRACSAMWPGVRRLGAERPDLGREEPAAAVVDWQT